MHGGGSSIFHGAEARAVFRVLCHQHPGERDVREQHIQGSNVVVVHAAAAEECQGFDGTTHRFDFFTTTEQFNGGMQRQQRGRYLVENNSGRTTIDVDNNG